LDAARTFHPQSAILNCSSLPLLVLGVDADDAHDPLPADDLAVFTDAFNAASHFHDFFSSSKWLSSRDVATTQPPAELCAAAN
jgi:hypothetical protein